jgi:hypothetical protein
MDFVVYGLIANSEKNKIIDFIFTDDEASLLGV